MDLGLTTNILSHTQKTHTHTLFLLHTHTHTHTPTHTLTLFLLHTHTKHIRMHFKRMCPRFQVQNVCVREREILSCVPLFLLTRHAKLFLQQTNKLWSRLNESQIDLKVSLDEGVSLTIIGGNTKEIVNNADEQTQM
jgi:hypothetical protein